jgi:hypothetical protein
LLLLLLLLQFYVQIWRVELIVVDDDGQHELQFQIENHVLFSFFVRNPNYHPSFSERLNDVVHARKDIHQQFWRTNKRTFTSRNNKATKTPFIFCEDSNWINIPWRRIGICSFRIPNWIGSTGGETLSNKFSYHLILRGIDSYL